MAEKRKASLTLLLRYQGKKESQKIELFPALLWREKHQGGWPYNWYEYRYRLRINGKWFNNPDNKYSFFTKWEFRDMLWRSINF